MSSQQLNLLTETGKRTFHGPERARTTTARRSVISLFGSICRLEAVSFLFVIDNNSPSKSISYQRSTFLGSAVAGRRANHNNFILQLLSNLALLPCAWLRFLLFRHYDTWDGEEWLSREASARHRTCGPLPSEPWRWLSKYYPARYRPVRLEVLGGRHYVEVHLTRMCW